MNVFESLETKLSESDVLQFRDQGYLLIKALLSAEEVEFYREIYDTFLNDDRLSEGLRSDLSGVSKPGQAERITQIMVPSRQIPKLLGMPIHQRCLQISQQLLGNDMALDFDMLIDKAPFSDTPTPWHQDSAYWLKMPDLRALSCWITLDKATVDSGCMWYVPASHKQETRKHQQLNASGPLICECSEDEGVAVEVNPGDCVIHHGNTIHYSRGNSTSHRRRAFITNFRPAEMVKFERQQGYDHTGNRSVRNSEAKS